ncbi:hypothetical protein BCON_0346g00100 [Botryotinia convoluta]|uniref:Uncharacterized protein n=1 Tax=Botryotinia convoluta TaxID=54673 RepID=A0A4Z1HAJ5_9HELO|nr:hypothetical protein BCON_0346g00100 [Botryotinia convoluta]
MACVVLDGTSDSSLQKMESIFKEIDGALIEALKCVPLLVSPYWGNHKDPRYRTVDPECDEGFGICESHLHEFGDLSKIALAVEIQTQLVLIGGTEDGKFAFVADKKKCAMLRAQDGILGLVDFIEQNPSRKRI